MDDTVPVSSMPRTTPEPPACINCGTPQADGWVVTFGAKVGALLSEEGQCLTCGAAFWEDVDDDMEEESGG